MRDEVAELVYPVLTLGLDLKERLERGEPADIDKAQSDLKQRLADRRWNELGEGGPVDPFLSQTVTGTRMASSPRFLGIRFPIVCWLDELFVVNSRWGQLWEERLLEWALYGHRLRANLFWEQAERAEVRPGSDALEVYYLCVMLGFRGDYRERPDQLQAWVDKVRPQVIRGYGEEPPQRDSSTPENYVPLLTGRDRFQAMLIVWGWVLALLALAVGFTIMAAIISGTWQ
jgi:type VI secretion system protein ImpK